MLLAHVEDDQVFSRCADVIGKIPNIETELAVAAILRKHGFRLSFASSW